MADKIVTSIQNAARRLLPEMIRIRRDLHLHPELSFQEERTSAQVKAFLSKIGIDYTEGWAGGHGVVASVKGEKEGPLVMLRSDMDALPIQEENDVPYRSVHDGVMHACGHDVHTACALGAAAILHEHRKELRGEVSIIFQPGEEKLPGGASKMVEEGIFRPNPPKWIIGQHVYPALPAGHVGFRSGQYMASADEIYITIHGKGGHAATPHKCIDPIVIAARVVTALQEVISRSIDPVSPGVLTIGKIWSDGGATNVIPDAVHMEGTLRAMDESWRSRAHLMIRGLVDQICLASGATAETQIAVGYPNLKNDPATTDYARQAAIAYLGADKVHDLPLRMTSEDFAFYTLHAPATFYRLGTGRPDQSSEYPLHSGRFDVHEAAIEPGMGLFAYLCLR